MKVSVELELTLVGQVILPLRSPSHHSWSAKILVSWRLQSHQVALVVGLEQECPPQPPALEPSTPLDDADTMLREILEGARNVIYEAKEDTPGISFQKEDRNEPQWVPVKVMSKSGGEYDARYLKACRSVKFAKDDDGTPFFSVQYGHCRFPTPIALRIRSRLKQNIT